MSLQEGAIIGTDLSPVANILGTQIADKTLQFRNFNESVFKIVMSDSILVTKNASATNAQASVAHNLNFTPAYVCYVASGSELAGTPQYTFDGSTGAFIIGYDNFVDNNSIYFNIYTPSSSPFYGSTIGVTFKYFLLEQTATS